MTPTKEKKTDRICWFFDKFEKAQMQEILDLDFKLAILNMCKELKQTMSK